MSTDLQTILNSLAVSTSIVPGAVDLHPAWLDTYERHRRLVLRSRAGIEPPFPEDELEYHDKFCFYEEADLRVYKPANHSVHIVVPNDYATILDEVRALQEAAVHDSSAAERLLAHPYRHRARPEDFILHLDELPDSSYIRQIVLYDWANPYDPWLIARGGNKSHAAATKHNDVEFYQADLNGWLGINVKHEWCHLAQARFPELIATFNHAVNSEWYEWIPDTGALRTMGEHFALLGQVLMHREGAQFLDTAWHAPVRTVAFMDVLERALNAAARPCLHEQVWRARLKAVADVVLPLAQAKVEARLKMATALNGYLPTRVAAA